MIFGHIFLPILLSMKQNDFIEYSKRGKFKSVLLEDIKIKKSEELWKNKKLIVESKLNNLVEDEEYQKVVNKVHALERDIDIMSRQINTTVNGVIEKNTKTAKRMLEWQREFRRGEQEVKGYLRTKEWPNSEPSTVPDSTASTSGGGTSPGSSVSDSAPPDGSEGMGADERDNKTKAYPEVASEPFREYEELTDEELDSFPDGEDISMMRKYFREIDLRNEIERIIYQLERENIEKELEFERDELIKTIQLIDFKPGDVATNNTLVAGNDHPTPSDQPGGSGAATGSTGSTSEGANMTGTRVHAEGVPGRVRVESIEEVVDETAAANPKTPFDGGNASRVDHFKAFLETKSQLVNKLIPMTKNKFELKCDLIVEVCDLIQRIPDEKQLDTAIERIETLVSEYRLFLNEYWGMMSQIMSLNQ